MKKFLSIFSTCLLSLLAFSCVNEEFATFDETKATAPVIGSYELGEKALTGSYTPGAFNMGFNDKMPVNHSLILASVDGKPVNKALTASFKDTEFSVSINNLAKALVGLGYPEGSIVSMDMFIRASMQAPSQDNGRNGHVDSQGHITISGFEVFIPVVQGNPWVDFTGKSPLGLIGSIASTGNGWNKDEPMYMTEDGTRHVAKNIVLTSGDAFKIRTAGSWDDVDLGGPGEEKPYVAEIGSPFEAAAKGKDMSVPADGAYDILYDSTDGTITITEAYQTYPGFDQKSNWGITGSVASRKINWDKDISMMTDGDWHVAEGVELTTADAFKFRTPGTWNEGDFGGPGEDKPYVAAIDDEISGAEKGKDISVSEDGVYDILFNPGAGLFKITPTLGGFSPLVGDEGGDEPDEPDEPELWSLIGTISGTSWDTDFDMTETSEGVWAIRDVEVTVNDEFKLRMNHDWSTNVGGTENNSQSTINPDDPYGVYKPEIGAAFQAGGSNIQIGVAGKYNVTYDKNEGTITIVESVVTYPDFQETSDWGVIGSIASRKIEWDNDVSMRTDGTWHVAEGVNLTTSDRFKFRLNQSWETNIGGEGEEGPYVVTIDQELTGVSDGKDLAVPEDGVYDLLVNPSAGLYKVVVSLGGYSPNINNDQPEPGPAVTGWNIIGLGGDWDHDVLAAENDGVWTAYVSVAEATEFKWRKDGEWAENYGGDIVAVGEPFDAVEGGNNIPLEPGFWKLELDTDALKITVTEGQVWSLIGNFNEWGGDVDMVQGEDGRWVAKNVALTTGWKIRHNHDWSVNRGGTFAELGKPFAVNDGGADIDCGEGNFDVVYDPAEETITVTVARKSGIWSLIGVDGDWDNDIDMTEVMPGVWVSPMINTTTSWKVRYDHGWDVNRGGAAPSAEGVFVKAVPGGDNVEFTGSFKVVYNANNETIGTLVWGVVGKVASITGFEWNNDIPMNLGTDGKWYSIPIALADGDEIKIRKYGLWDDNRGGDCAAADEAFAVTNGGNNIKAPAAGTYMLVYDPEAETITLSTGFWSLIGEFNEWKADTFMICNGNGEWAAYGQSLAGNWKIRQNSGWEVNRGGTFAERGTAFEAVPDGDNINVGDITGFDIIYDSKAETITVK